MKFKVKIYYDSKVVEGIMEVKPIRFSDELTRTIMLRGILDSVVEIKKKEAKS